MGFLKEMWRFPNNFLLCTQPEEEEEDETPAGQEEEELNEDDLPRVQNEVDDLQQQFDASVVDKHSLAMELESMKERLKTATDIIDRLVEREIPSDISFVFASLSSCLSNYVIVYWCVCPFLLNETTIHFLLNHIFLVIICSVVFLLYNLILVTSLFVNYLLPSKLLELFSICSLRSQEQQWRVYLKEHSSNDMLIANCLSAAAFLVYCGALNTDTR